MTFRILCVCSLSLLAAWNDSVHAQTPQLRGVVVGLSLQHDRYGADTLATRDGAGLGALLGFGVTQNVALLVEAGFAVGGQGLSAHADLAARLSVPLTARAAIYAQAAFASHGREAPGDRMFLGDGLSLAVGAELFFRPHRSITISVAQWNGNYDELRPDRTKVDVDAESLRFSVGMNLRPPR
jgi:hypothetical protein